jgi:transaldolase
VFEELDGLGVHYDDVVQVLEIQGVEKFAASWQEMSDTIKREMAAGGSTT